MCHCLSGTQQSQGFWSQHLGPHSFLLAGPRFLSSVFTFSAHGKTPSTCPWSLYPHSGTSPLGLVHQPLAPWPGASNTGSMSRLSLPGLLVKPLSAVALVWVSAGQDLFELEERSKPKIPSWPQHPWRVGHSFSLQARQQPLSAAWAAQRPREGLQLQCLDVSFSDSPFLFLQTLPLSLPTVTRALR